MPADLKEFIYSLKNDFTYELISDKNNSIQMIETK